MIDTTGLSKEDKAAFLAAYTEIERCFAVSIEDDITLPLDKLELFRAYSHIAYDQALRVNEGKQRALAAFVQVEYTYTGNRGGQYRDTEYQFWAVAFLPKNFGHLIIKPETFKDKLMEWLQPLEMNFPEDRTFCRKFYVLAKDQAKASQLLTPAFRQEVKRTLVRDFYLEVLDDLLIIGNKKALSNQEVLALTSFVYNVSELDYLPAET